MDGSVFKKEALENAYEIGDDIGSGHFAVVRRVIHKKSGEAFAAKFIRKRRGGGRKGARPEEIQREVCILKQLDHENVIRLYDVYETSIEVILILELVTGGELFDYISEKDHLGEEEASAFIAQILKGVKHLHDHHIAHLDLKPENIMLRNRNTQSIKLIDFGLAHNLSGKEDVRAMMGTAEFVAPEVVSYETLSLATDMWSVGVITYILLSGASPFLGDNQQETYHNITAIQYQFDEEYFSNTSELAKDFITKLFVKIPKKRATVDDCLNHPWIRPKQTIELIKRQSAIININNFKAFMARKRWRQSMRIVSLCNRLSKSMLLRKSSDTLNSSGNTLDEEKTKSLSRVVEASSSDATPTEPSVNTTSAQANITPSHGISMDATNTISTENTVKESSDETQGDSKTETEEEIIRITQLKLEEHPQTAELLMDTSNPQHASEQSASEEGSMALYKDHSQTMKDDCEIAQKAPECDDENSRTAEASAQNVTDKAAEESETKKMHVENTSPHIALVSDNSNVESIVCANHERNQTHTTINENIELKNSKSAGDNLKQIFLNSEIPDLLGVPPKHAKANPTMRTDHTEHETFCVDLESNLDSSIDTDSICPVADIIKTFENFSNMNQSNAKETSPKKSFEQVAQVYPKTYKDCLKCNAHI